MREKSEEIENSREEQKNLRKKAKILIILLIILAIVVGWVLFSQSKKRETPNLVNLSVKEAEQMVSEEEYGLVLEEVKEEYSDQVKRECIISQIPVPGRMVSKGDTIKIVVSAGELREIPYIETKSIKKAKALLAKEGLVLKVIDSEYSDTVKKGCIITQKPEAFNKVHEGSRIKVIESKGIKQVTVPAVENEKKNTAIKKIEKAKFRYKISHKYSSSVKKGLSY